MSSTATRDREGYDQVSIFEPQLRTFSSIKSLLLVRNCNALSMKLGITRCRVSWIDSRKVDFVRLKCGYSRGVDVHADENACCVETSMQIKKSETLT